MGVEREIQVPDIGDFDEVDVIEVLVAPGDRVEAEDSLITLESDKATLEVPSPVAGVVKELLVRVGDKVSEGRPIARIEVDGEAGARSAPRAKAPDPAARPGPAAAPASRAEPAPRQEPAPRHEPAPRRGATPPRRAQRSCRAPSPSRRRISKRPLRGARAPTPAPPCGASRASSASSSPWCLPAGPRAAS